jgi:hypothetical protein
MTHYRPKGEPGETKAPSYGRSLGFMILFWFLTVASSI